MPPPAAATSAPTPTSSRSIGDPLGTEEFGFIFTPGSDLVAPFNAAIAQMKADGYLDYLNNRWFFLTDPERRGCLRQAAGPERAEGGGGDGERLHAAQLRRPGRPGKAVGWEYDAVNEICRRLNCTGGLAGDRRGTR